MEQLLALAWLGGICWTHRSRRSLVILVDEVLQSQLCIEHTAILPLLNDHIVKEPTRSTNKLIVCALANLEQLFLDAKLIVEPLAS